jgi:hypothetical protein
MELAIPLVAVGGLYVASRQKENFETSRLPNVDLKDKNYIEEDEEVDGREETYTSKLSTVNKYDGPKAYTDKYFNRDFNIARASKYSSMGEVNEDRSYMSLTGEKVQKDYFEHNNMVPFFGSNVRSKNIEASSNEATLDNYVGSGSTYISKKEQAPLFNPGENYNYPNGAPNATDFVRSRMNPSNKMSNVNPFKQESVAPGLGLGYTTEGNGGFNSGMMERDSWNAKTVDELRVLTNQKSTGNLVLGYEGPANSHIKNMGNHGKQEKNRVDRDFQMTSDRLFTTMGLETKPTQRSEHIKRNVARPSTSVTYSGNASYGNSSHYVDGDYEESHRTPLDSYPLGIANAEGTSAPNENDFGINSNNAYPNNRSVGKQEGYFGAIGSVIGEVISPITDILKTTRKEKTINSLRPYNNPKSEVSNSYLYNPTHTVRPTIRQDTEKSKMHMNVNMNAGGVGGYTVTKNQPIRNARTTQSDFMYIGGSSGSNNRETRSQEAEKNQRNNEIKSSTITGRLAQGNMNLYSGSINQSNKEKDRDLVNNRPIARHGVKSSPSIQHMGHTNAAQPLFQNINDERNTSDIRNALQGNPYVIPYMGKI